MDCTPAQKVRYGTHMLTEEADDWWLETSLRLESAGEETTWVVFRREFMRKCYPEDIRGKNEIEFLEVKQGNLSVTEYAAKFVELAKFYSHYNEATAEFSKCIKFESGLRPEIKKEIGYQKIRAFSYLVDSCRIYEEDNDAHRKISNEKKRKHQNRGKPYDAPASKGKQRATDGERTSGGDTLAGIVCSKCGKACHKRNVCKAETKRCFRCGGIGHEITECKHKGVICFNCGEEGHISSQCQKPKKERASGRVFALVGTANEDGLIRGICFISSTPLVVIVDTNVSRCFVVVDCVLTGLFV